MLHIHIGNLSEKQDSNQRNTEIQKSSSCYQRKSIFSIYLSSTYFRLYGVLIT